MAFVWISVIVVVAVAILIKETKEQENIGLPGEGSLMREDMRVSEELDNNSTPINQTKTRGEIEVVFNKRTLELFESEVRLEQELTLLRQRDKVSRLEEEKQLLMQRIKERDNRTDKKDDDHHVELSTLAHRKRPLAHAVAQNTYDPEVDPSTSEWSETPPPEDKEEEEEEEEPITYVNSSVMSAEGDLTVTSTPIRRQGSSGKTKKQWEDKEEEGSPTDDRIGTRHYATEEMETSPTSRWVIVRRDLEGTAMIPDSVLIRDATGTKGQRWVTEEQLEVLRTSGLIERDDSRK